MFNENHQFIRGYKQRRAATLFADQVTRIESGAATLPSMVGKDASLSPDTSPTEMLLSQLPRELRNRIYSYLIPGVLELKVHRFCLMPAQELEQTKRVADVEAVPSASWQQLANVKLVCRQIRDELSEEIESAKKTTATVILVDMPKAPNYGQLQNIKSGSFSHPTRQLNPAYLANFAVVTFGMPFITLEECADPDHPFWQENGIAHYEDIENLGGYDFWYGRFKYRKHKNGQGTNTWTLSAMEADLLVYDDHIKTDLVDNELKFAAVKKLVDIKVVEKQLGGQSFADSLAELQALLTWTDEIHCKDDRFWLLSSEEGIDTVNDYELLN